jgi:hypothetical protein
MSKVRSPRSLDNSNATNTPPLMGRHDPYCHTWWDACLATLHLLKGSPAKPHRHFLRESDANRAQLRCSAEPTRTASSLLRCRICRNKGHAQGNPTHAHQFGTVIHIDRCRATSPLASSWLRPKLSIHGTRSFHRRQSTPPTTYPHHGTRRAARSRPGISHMTARAPWLSLLALRHESTSCLHTQRARLYGTCASTNNADTRNAQSTNALQVQHIMYTSMALP